VPGLDRVSSRRHSIDLERAHCVAYGKVGIRHNADVSVHPVVHVAFEVQHDFFALRLELINQAGSRLRDIEAVFLSGECVDVVQELIAVFDLNGLADASADDTRRVHASHLIDDYRLRGHGRLREVPFQTHEHIRETPVGRGDDKFLDDTLARIHLRAHRIHTHSDDWIAG